MIINMTSTDFHSNIMKFITGKENKLKNDEIGGWNDEIKLLPILIRLEMLETWNL